jgi:anti-anti-sigma factor
MEITWRRHDCRTIVELSGRCIASDGERELLPLRHLIAGLIGEAPAHVGVDMRHLSAVDAHGLGELVAIYRRLNEAGGSLTLIAPTERVRRLLGVTRLDTFIPIAETAAAYFLTNLWSRDPTVSAT